MKICWSRDRADELGIPCESRNAQIFDANGLLWRHVISCDTEIGEIEYMKLDKNGKIQIDPDTLDALAETIKTAAPLLVKWV